MIMVGPVPPWRTGAGISCLAKIVAGFVETGNGPIGGIPRVETVRGGRNVEDRPVAEYSGGRVRILDDEDEALGSVRRPGPCQRR